MSSILAEEMAPAAPPSLNFEQVLDASRDYIWVLNLDGTVAYSNGAARLLSEPGRLHRGLWRDLWPDSERFTADRAFRNAASGIMASFRIQLSLESGARIYLQIRVTPVSDLQGRVAHLLVSGRDATPEVEQTAFLNSIVELLPLALLVKDVPSDRYVLANRAAHDLLGTDEPITGRTTVEVFQPLHAEMTLEHDAAAIISGGAQTAEIEIEHGGQTRWVAAQRVTTFDDAGPRHLITLAEDVTSRRRDAESLGRALVAAEDAGRARSAFLANMSHEIRTPLNGVIAGAEMLAGRDLGEAERELVEMVRTSSAILSQRLDEILEMVRLDTGEIRLEAHPFRPAELLALLHDSHGPRATAKGLTLDVQVAPELPPMLVGDHRRIRQALAHLTDNAIKFSEKGAVVLSAAPGPDGFVRFCARDQGVGFAETDKPRLFARFHQQDDSLTRPHGGLGLGLAAARDLAELMGGLVDAEPCHGGGSRFWIDLPLRLPEEVRASEAAPCAGPSGRADPLRILAVDDHPANRRILELLLADAGCITLAENGRDAVQAWSEEDFDIVLMDIQMPVMDGLQATREIRRLEGETGRSRTPIMMLSANCEAEHVSAGRAAGADHHMAKPFTGPALLQAVRDMLKP